MLVESPTEIELFQSLTGDRPCDGIIGGNDSGNEQIVYAESDNTVSPVYNSCELKNRVNEYSESRFSSDMSIDCGAAKVLEFIESEEDDFDKKLFEDAIKITRQNTKQQTTEDGTRTTAAKQQSIVDHEFMIPPCTCKYFIDKIFFFSSG